MGLAKESIYRELLVVRCRRGQREAFAELVETYEERLFYYVRRLVGNEQDAWDVLQEVWIDVMRGIRSLRNAQSLSSWLYRIARNKSMAHWRGVHRKPVRQQELEPCEDTEPQEEESCFNDAERVHEGLQLVSHAHRDVLTLYFLRDLSMNEIADVLGLSVGTVKSRLHYAKRSLRDVLRKGLANGK